MTINNAHQKNYFLKDHQMNPVVETYRGRKIRQYPLLQIRVSVVEMKRFIDLQIDHNFSPREVIFYSSRPCEKCKGMDVVVWDDNGEKATIRRGILKEKR